MHFTRITLCYLAKRYLTLLKMAEELIDLMPDAPQSDTKGQKLLDCIFTGNSKLHLGKVYTEEQVSKLSDEEVDKLFKNYEANLLGQGKVIGKIDHPYVFNGSLCSFRNKRSGCVK